MPVTLNAFTQWGIQHLLGTERGKEVESFINSGVGPAIAALVKGDVPGFIAALPTFLQSPVQAYINTEVSRLLAQKPDVGTFANPIPGS